MTERRASSPLLDPNKRRLQRIFGPDGRTLIVAMDHLSKLGREPILRDAGRVIREVVDAGADAILARHGLARRHREPLGRVGLILAVDEDPPSDEFGVELALRLGADGVKVLAFPSSPQQPHSRAHLARLSARCDAWQMPLLAEMIPVGFGTPDAHTAENIVSSARLGADMGADFVKVPYTGDTASFREVVATAEVPVVILGGSDGGTEALFTQVRGALDAGAAGAAIGRRIWSHPSPGRITEVLARLVHDELSVGQAQADVTRVTVG